MGLEKKYFSQLSHYLTGYVLTSAMGFLTFPILTRILPVNEYGILGLITNTIWIALAVAGLGLQKSSIRYYEEFRANKDRNSASVYYSTFLLSSFFFGLSGCLIFLLITQIILKIIADNVVIDLLIFVSIWIMLGCIGASLTTFLRAEQKTKIFNLISIIGRIGSIGLSFFFFFYIIKGLYGYFFGLMMSQFLIMIFLLKKLVRTQTISFKFYSHSFLKRALKYGMPLCIMDISYNLLNFSDRYVIQYYLNLEALGLYSAAYTLSMQIVQVIDYPILSVVPVIYFELWEKKGKEEVQKFLRSSLKYFSLITIPIMIGSIAVSKELLIFLASRKYEIAAPIIPYVLSGGIIFASSTLITAGLYIYEKSMVAAGIMLVAALLNLGFSIILVPKYHLAGAAIATFLGHISYVVLITPISIKYLSYKPDFRALGRYFIYSIIMVVIINQINLNNNLQNLIIRVAVGTIIYLCLVFIFEEDIRRYVKNNLIQIKTKKEMF